MMDPSDGDVAVTSTKSTMMIPLPPPIQDELKQKLKLEDFHITPAVNVARPRFEPVRLHFAINKEDMEGAMEQVKKGVDLNFIIHGNSPLMLACLRHQFDIAMMLIDAGADVTIGEVYPWRRRPVHLASMMNMTELLITLLDHGAGVQAADGMMMTPLHWAASYGAIDCINLLLDRGAHLEVRDDRGKTPLHRAVASNRLDVVSVLKEAGAHVNMQDSFGWTPLNQAVFCSLPVVKMLLQYGAETNIRDHRGFTCLHLMLLRHDFVHLKILAKSDLQYYTRDRKITSSSTVGVSVFLTDPVILEMLLDYGLDINMRSPHGTALELAIKLNQPSVVQWLLHGGADIPLNYIYSQEPDLNHSILVLIQDHKHFSSLRDICKSRIRQFLYSPISTHIESLPLPVVLKQWLQLTIPHQTES